MNKPHAPTTRLVGDPRLKGVELGGANSPHENGNSFFLQACVNVAPAESERFYYGACTDGHRGFCHLHGHAAFIPLYNDTLDYIISSHVMEHIPDPIRAWKEWVRVLKPNGLVLMIVPHHDALRGDKRPVEDFTLDRVWQAHRDRWHQDNIPVGAVHGGPYGHWWKWTPEVLQAAIEKWMPYWVPIDFEDPDSKVGNGFFLAYRLRTSKLQGE